MFAFDCHQQRFAVPFDYPVYFTKDLFHPQNPLFALAVDRYNEDRVHRMMVFIDSGVVQAMPHVPERIRAYIGARPANLRLEGSIQVVPGGEQSKNSWEYARQTIKAIADRRLCRQSFVVAVGGGSVLDAVGLAASLIHRGVRLIRVPTTVLAQNDAGVGVKNGINDRGVKNFMGTFAPPFAVLNDFQFLRTLSIEHWLGGVAEAFKVAIIKDRDFFYYLSRHATRLRARDEASMEETVKRCAILHLDHIRTTGDPFESGSARPLDFGHWSAHRLEALSDYDISHGQAVSIGMAMDCFYAFGLGLLSEKECDAIMDAFKESGLRIWSELLEQRTSTGDLEILKGIDDFQEHLGGELNVTLPDGIGKKVEIHQIDPVRVGEAISCLKRNSERIPRSLLQGASKKRSGILEERQEESFEPQ
ncbi:MAG: 3-dehydroquinate synthase [Desulfobacterales bacterium]|nr:3-dehydroquinate synthase [Desulfobacterales bacterium]